MLSAVDYLTGKPVPYKQLPEGVLFNMKDMPQAAYDNVIKVKLSDNPQKLPNRSKWIM
jgi:hypothetical protein